MQVGVPVSTESFPPPRDKATLASYITEAAMLEQQFMCQYLYAALSLKKQPDATCSPAELEVVRRWASKIYMIARQEMEHLSIANSMLTAIGYPPWFGHDNFPTQSRWYQSSALLHKKAEADDPDPCDFPFLLQSFDLSVAQRFCCMESPELKWVAPQDRANLLAWCYESPTGGCASVPELPAPPLSRSFLGQPNQPPNTVEPGTVQQLYAAIEGGLQYLNSLLGSKALFSGHQSGQEQIPTEYDIYLFPICNLETAVAGIRLITTQGEGIDAPPGYESHYQNFYDIAVEYAAMLEHNPAFQPSFALPLNPKIEQYTIPITANAVAAFNQGYVALLYMLAGYYGNYTSARYAQHPYLSQALEQTAFAPMMTMLIRSLGELITQLPADAEGTLAGPTFYLSPDVLARLSNPLNPIYLDLNFYISSLEAVYERLDVILAKDDPPPALKPKFEYVQENVERMMANLQYIFANGIYPKFAGMPTCPQDDGCQ